MTLEQQVHQLQVTVDSLVRRVAILEGVVQELQKNSHPPIDFIERIAQAINNQEIFLRGNVTIDTDQGSKTSHSVIINTAALGD